MLTRCITGMLFLAMTFLPVNAMAQRMHGGGKWWYNPSTCKQLNLTDAEKTKLDEQFKTTRSKMIDLKGRVEKEQLELENLLDAKELDEKALQAQHQKLEQARTALADERFGFIMQTRKILGNERFQQVKMHMQMNRGKQRQMQGGPCQ